MSYTRIDQLKSGDIFTYDDYFTGESHFIIVDRKDYAKMFGRQYPYAGILTFKLKGKITDTTQFQVGKFCHFGYSGTLVNLIKPTKKLGDLNEGIEFEYNNNKYVVAHKKGNGICACVRLTGEYLNKLQFLDENIEICPN